MSRYCSNILITEGNLKVSTLGDITIPYAEYSTQKIFEKIYAYRLASINNQGAYEFYSRVIDVMVEQLYLEDKFYKENINLIEDIGLLEDLPDDKEEASIKANEQYIKVNNAKSPIKSNLLKAIPIENEIYLL